MRYKPSVKDLSPLYVIIVFYFIYAIQMYRIGYFPCAYFIGFYGIGCLVFGFRLQRYHVEVREDGLFVQRVCFSSLFIPWSEISKIEYKNPYFQSKRIYITYTKNGKPKQLFFIKNFFSHPELIREISYRTNIPLPDKYLKFRDKLLRIYRRDEIIWGILFTPLTYLAGWSYRLVIPYGLTIENWISSYFIFTIALIINCYIVNRFDYHPTSKRNLQIWCFVGALTSMIGLPNLQIYFNDSWTYYGYGIFFAGIFGFNILLFIPDSKYQHKYYVPVLILAALLTWQVPMWLIPRAQLKELQLPLALYSYGFTPDGKLCNYGGSTITIYPTPKGNGDAYSLVQDTAEGVNTYFTRWSPDHQKMAYESHLSKYEYEARNHYVNIFDYKNHQSHRIYQQMNVPDKPRYSSIIRLSCFNWSPDSRYFIFTSPVYSQATIAPEYDLMVYDSIQSTTQRIYHTKELMPSAWWGSNSTIYYFMDKEMKPGGGKVLHYSTLWKVNPVISSTGQWFPIQPVKDYEWNVPLTSFEPVCQGNYLYCMEAKEEDDKVINSFYSILLKKRIEFPGRVQFSITPLREESFHPMEEKVLYAINTEKRGILYEFDIKTGTSREIIREREYIDEPCYSFDGKRIAYVVADRLLGSIVSIKSDGTDWKKVTSTIIPEVGYGPINPLHCWSPTENTLYVGMMAERFMLDENRIKIYLADVGDKKK